MEESQKLNWKEAFLKSPGPKTWKEAFALYMKGVAMGGADIIPGVSGGLSHSSLEFMKNFCRLYNLSMQSLFVNYYLLI